MAKISPVAAKYIVTADITISGVVDRPDVIGAIFGQTEGLLGNDLELRELQRSGRIGRIEVNVKTTSGKTKGEIIIPSSLDKTETAIIAAALEIIQRIGPCNAEVLVQKIEDVRTSKRQFVVNRAKELLRNLTDSSFPDSQELADEVSQSVRQMEMVEYGREKLAAGPMIDDSEDIIVVEGRADVLVLLKHGFKNVITLNGTSCPETIKELTKQKTTTVFVDGDRGGDLIIRELLGVAEIDFICKAPDGKEVVELTKKEIHKALRGKITAEQGKLDLGVNDDGSLKEEARPNRQFKNQRIPHQASQPSPQASQLQQRATNGRPQKPLPVLNKRPLSSGNSSKPLIAPEGKILKDAMEDLFGTRGARIFDNSMKVLGNVPLSELEATLKSLSGGVYALALDGEVNDDLAQLAEKVGVRHVVGTSSKARSSRINILTEDKI
ncbi:DNA primase [Candidatus Woesearchaeota archaeon]|nr:DNA primase [Candidatus Woesearchaeota archaeon]